MKVRKQELELSWNNRLVPKEKEYVKAVYCHPAYLTYTEYIMKNAGLDEAQAGIKIAGRNSNNLRHADDITGILQARTLEWSGLPFPSPMHESEK